MIQNPRPYDVVIIFTVKSGCLQCADVYNEYIGTAYSYEVAQEKIERPVFFVVFYYTKDRHVRDIFSSHGFKTVPYIAATKMQVKREQAGGENESVYAGFFKTENLWLIKKDEIYDTHK